MNGEPDTRSRGVVRLWDIYGRYFEVRVYGVDVARAKRDPDGFMRELGWNAIERVTVEDP